MARKETRESKRSELHLTFAKSGETRKIEDQSWVLVNYSPNLPKVGVKVRVNPNPREGWVSSLLITVVDPRTLRTLQL